MVLKPQSGSTLTATPLPDGAPSDVAPDVAKVVETIPWIQRVPIANLFYEIMDQAPPIDQVITLLETLGVVSALLLGAILGTLSSVGFEEIEAANERFQTHPQYSEFIDKYELGNPAEELVGWGYVGLFAGPMIFLGAILLSLGHTAKYKSNFCSLGTIALAL
ncbi:hypothetical protein CYMTET_20978 [Cymbomonas tetramitiformis]|uniref:Uncharacterized protein n=1 Tax=Cymbomonas tetramitiformis TaxID=36881 RepID=A0AAE0L3B7_9CHLO|nr:hypothetical protein CYMTET_20978 [Cymbomonas tetramitiformis]